MSFPRSAPLVLLLAFARALLAQAPDINDILDRMERAQTLRRVNQDRIVIQPGFAIQLRIIELAAGTKNIRSRVDGCEVSMFSFAGKLKHVDGKLPGENREDHHQREGTMRDRLAHWQCSIA